MGLIEAVGFPLGKAIDTAQFHIRHLREGILFSRINTLTARLKQARKENPGIAPISYRTFLRFASDAGFEADPNHLARLTEAGYKPGEIFYDEQKDKFAIIDGNPDTPVQFIDPDKIP